MNYPVQIEAAALSVATYQERLREIREQLAEVNDELLRQIFDATDAETGKKLFTNEQARDLALRERQRESDEWQQCHNLEEAAIREIARAQARLERLRGEFAIWKIEERGKIVGLETMI